MAKVAENHWIYPFVAMAAGGLLLLRLWHAAAQVGPTTDEPCHIGAAVSMVEAHKSVALVSHPPLAHWVAAVPLWRDGARLPQCRGMKTIQKEDAAYAFGTQVLYDTNSASYEKLLTDTRRAMLLFPVLSLLFLYLLGRFLCNDLAACAAVVFFSLDPTLLGHGMLVTTDAAAAAAFLAALYFGLRWVRSHSWLAALAAGLTFGLAVGTKFSCALILPIMIVVALTEWKKVSAKQIAAALLLAFVALWATYRFNIGPLGDQEVIGHPALWEQLPAWVRTTPVPMPSFFLGVARLAAHEQLGQAAYLNGEISNTGWWYYFPDLIGIKSTLAFLVALALALALWGVAWKRMLSWPARAILIPALIFLIAAMAGKIDIGIRHILPMIPLLYLFVGWQLARPGWLGVLAGLMFAAAVETGMIHPDYLSFFNVAARVEARAPERFALDSNLDWGQDVPKLAAWLKANANDRPYALRLTGQRNAPLLQALDIDPAALQAPAHGHLLCISKNRRLIDRRLPWLANYQPIAHVGDSIEIYDLTADPGAPGDDEPEDTPPVDNPAMK